MDIFIASMEKPLRYKKERGAKMVNGKTKSGIKFQIDERVKDDARFLYYLTKAQDKTADLSEQGKAVVDILTLIFGNEEGVIGFMNAVASVHDGICTTETMMDELTEILSAINAKN